jgi:V8-like Glu-specific endopeptidase
MMRVFSVVILALSILTPGALAVDDADQMSASEIGQWLRIVQGKPGMTPATDIPDDFQGDDSCRWANDNECDDPRYGTGACEINTDHSDCWRILTGAEDDSCQWANDGECDEPSLGTGACVQGTDRTDCADVSFLRFQTDSCATAFDGICQEEALGGDGSCEPRTDRADCLGRERPMTLQGHHFGNDDRMSMNTAVFPWVVVGQITMDQGGACTATLIGPDILITAAHCILHDGRIDARGEFETGAMLEGETPTSQIIDYYLPPDQTRDGTSTAGDSGSHDWALLRINDRLGDQLGWIGIASYEADIWQGGQAPSLDTIQLFQVAAQTFAHNDQARSETGSGDTPATAGWAQENLPLVLMVAGLLVFLIGIAVGNKPVRIILALLGLVLVISGGYLFLKRPMTTGSADTAALPEAVDGGGKTPPVVAVEESLPAPLQAYAESILYQAGYSYDTGENLSGNLGCVVETVYENNTMAHQCDTVQGDSGSPLFVERGGQFYVIATDSRYGESQAGPTRNIATRSDAWVPFYEAFASGEIGEGSPRPRGPGKPGEGQDPDAPASGKAEDQ